jgi:hypothetical protein
MLAVPLLLGDPNGSLAVAVIVKRLSDLYTARVGPPELDRDWETDRPYRRDELRRTIEDLGVDPIDVADAFDQADVPTSTSRVDRMWR